MPREITFREALNEALHLEMERDPTRHRPRRGRRRRRRRRPGRSRGLGRHLRRHQGPATEVRRGPRDRHADLRVRDHRRRRRRGRAPGLRPVAELMFVDFIGVCIDQIFNQVAKFRYMFGGKAVTPVVIRTMIGAGLNAAAQHSQYALRAVHPRAGTQGRHPVDPVRRQGPADPGHPRRRPGDVLRAQGALRPSRARCRRRATRFRSARRTCVREGDDVTVVAIGRMVHTSLEAADAAGQAKASSAR